MKEVITGKIYSFKMNSGEEIIAMVEEIHMGNMPHYLVSAPLSIAPSQQGLQLIPAMFSSEVQSETNIYMHSVSMVSVPRIDVGDAYRESTTGIKVPATKILLG